MNALGPFASLTFAGPGRRLAAAALLTCVAAVPRFYQLGHLSLYGDEPYTALSARALLDTGESQMPSGMPYHRALPFTWANAGTAAVLGPDREISYRVVAAGFGTLTPAAVFLTGTAFVSPSAAFVAGAMLSLSEWHIVHSRTGRMYSPFLFFFVLAAFCFWQWGTKGGRRRLLAALVLFGVTVSLHLLGLFAAMFAMLPVLFRKRAHPPPAHLLAVGLGAAVTAYLLNQQLIGATYADWSLPAGAGFQLEGQASRGPSTGADPDSLHAGVLVAAAGVLIGTWLGWALREDPGGDGPHADRSWRLLVVVGAGATAGAFTGLGYLWGAALAGAVMFLVRLRPAWELPARSLPPLLILTAGAMAWTAVAVGALGASDGFRRLVEVPFPYVALLWHQFSGLMALFVLGVLWLMLWPGVTANHGLRASVVAVIVSMAAIGLMREWGGTRYLLHTYPFVLLATGAVLVRLSERLTGWIGRESSRQLSAIPLILATVIGLSGASGGHGPGPAITAASVDHGEPVNQYTHTFPFRPDHRGPGLHVRHSLEPGDRVIAEDVDAQLFYAGRVDYWFRRAGDARRYVYLGPDSTVRDVYGNAILLTTPEAVQQAIRSAEGRVWLITSGETAPQRDWYLSQDQQAWLDSLESAVPPASLGDDGVTAAYCLNC